MVRVWKDEFSIRRTKYVQALNSNYILIHRVARSNTDLKSGLYYIEVDFHQLEPHGKLSEFIQSQCGTQLKTIFEYSETPNFQITRWDAIGTPLALGVSYVLKENQRSKVLLKVLTVLGEWALCQEDDLGETVVNSLEMISPPCNYSRIFALYGTENGLDGGHH